MIFYVKTSIKILTSTLAPLRIRIAHPLRWLRSHDWWRALHLALGKMYPRQKDPPEEGKRKQKARGAREKDVGGGGKAKRGRDKDELTEEKEERRAREAVKIKKDENSAENNLLEMRIGNPSPTWQRIESQICLHWEGVNLLVLQRQLSQLPHARTPPIMRYSRRYTAEQRPERDEPVGQQLEEGTCA